MKNAFLLLLAAACLFSTGPLRAQEPPAENPGRAPDSETADWDAIQHGRKRIAMLRFPCLSATYTVGDQTMAADTVADNLLSDFNQYFLQSTKFRVLSRQDDAAIGDEQLRILNNAAASGNDAELAKLTKSLGLDYILAGTVKQFHIAPPQVVTISLTGTQVVSIPSAMMELDCRIVEVATSEILWADHIILDLTQQEINDAGNDVVTLYHTLCQLASRRIAEAMDALAPIRVLRVQPDGTLVLDRGGTLMVPGSLFDVLRQGEPILDPITGEELGKPEYRVCTVQITQAPPTAKFSYAKIVGGSGVITPNDLEAGLIARPYSEPADTPPTQPAQKTTVILPFDR